MTTEYYVGTNATGSDGDTGRVITLTNTRVTTTTNFMVYLDGVLLASALYTATHNTNGSTVEFTGSVWDSQRIAIHYQTTTTSTTNGYCSADDIRALTNLTSSTIVDSDLDALIANATLEVNQRLNVTVVRERVGYLDQTRQNLINGSNTTYYIRNWRGKYMADYNNDGTVDTTDLIVYVVASDGTETEATVSSIDHNDGKLVLDTAYSSDYTLYISYAWSYFDEASPSTLLNLATAYLASAYSYLKIDTGANNVRFGNVSINKSVSQSFGMYYSRYETAMNELVSYSTLKDNYREAAVSI